MQYSVLGKYMAILRRQEQKYINKAMSQYRLGYSCYNFLLYIWNHPGASQKEMCYDLVLDEALAARAMKKLEIQGFICRKKSPCSRSYKLFLTQQGQQILIPLREALQDWYTHLTKDFSPEELSKTLQILSAMTDTALSTSTFEILKKDEEETNGTKEESFTGNRIY